ncbi:hypothetical protein Tco_1141582 [Tanacetum coccineum]
MFIQAHDPDFVPEPVYPEYIPLEDDHEFLAEEQPLPPIDSPTAESPRYITESDPEEDPEEYEDDKTEDGPVDYPIDGGDDGHDGDDDDGDSSRDDARDEDEDEEDEEDEEEEEHLAPADSVAVVPTASTQALIDAVTAALPSPSLPLLPPSLYIPPPVDHRDEIPKSEQPPHKRLCLSTLGSRYEIGESSTARPTRGRGTDYGFVSTVDAEERRQGVRYVGYGIKDTWVDSAEAVPKIAPMTAGEVNTWVTEIAELHERDTHDLYALLKDAQDGRSRISQRVDRDSQWVDLVMGDMMTLQETIWMVEEEAYASQEAWAHSIGLSQATHQELQTHRDHVREMGDMQAELLAHREQQRRARQPGPEARIPDHQDASGDADSHI